MLVAFGKGAAMKAVLGAMAACVVATASGQASAASADEQELLKLERQVEDAFLRNDVDWLDAHYFAPEWMINVDRGFVSRQEEVTDMREGLFKVTAGEIIDMKARTVGDMGYVLMLTRETTVDGPGAAPDTHVSTVLDVWERRGAQWICVASEARSSKPNGKLYGPNSPRPRSH